MADLNDVQSAGITKLVGSDSVGVEQTPIQSTSAGSIHTNLRNNAGTEIGTTANPISVSPGAASDLLGTGTVAALNGAVTVNTQGRGTLIFTLTGTWIATVIFEASVDGSTWVSVDGIGRPLNGRYTQLTSNYTVAIECAGFSQIRAKASAYTSGTINIAYDASAQINNEESNVGNNNAPIPVQSTLIGGSDGTNLVPIAVDSQGRLVTSSLTGFGADFSFGDITTAALTRTLVRRTAYTEQTTNGQRSIASSSANDTAVGTGARTLKITYLDQTGAGPFTEVLTLNGTARVNTVATNICFIEQIEILTAGSGGVNAGIITLYTVPTSGGTAIGTIAASDNQTFWAHHYVATSKTCNITGISCGHNGTTVGSGALFTLNAKSLSLANSVESQVSDFVRLYGQTSTFARTYSSPIKVLGPARLQMYVTPETASSTIYRGAFDFFEP